MYQTKLVLRWNKIDKISVYPTKRFFSKNTGNKLIVFSKYFHSKKGKRPVYFSLNWKFHVLMFFIYIFKKKLRMFWFIKQNKNIIHISFLINRFEIFRTTFQPITLITKKNISRSWKRTRGTSVNLTIIFVIKQNDRLKLMKAF